MKTVYELRPLGLPANRSASVRITVEHAKAIKADAGFELHRFAEEAFGWPGCMCDRVKP